MRLLLVGIDAMSYDFAVGNLDHLGDLKEFHLCRLENSEFIGYSSPALWNAIYTGVSPKEFAGDPVKEKGHLFNPQWVKHPYIWQVLENEGLSVASVNAPIQFPPVSYNTRFDIVGQGIPMNASEAEIELDRLLEKAKSLAGRDFVNINTRVLDGIQHVHEAKEGENIERVKVKQKLVLKLYAQVVKWLKQLGEYTERLVAVSDHGFYHPLYNEPVAKPEGPQAYRVHHPNGTLISNVGLDIPNPSILDVFPLILKLMEVS